jgi:nitrite reductase/ring-hydroxylating ferredoxin subunit
MDEPTFTAVASTADLPPDSVKLVQAGGRSILLVHNEGHIFAVENMCSHAQEPLACGRVKRGWIACPAHGARFDLETGEALGPPATDPIATFAVRISGDVVEVAV